MADITYQMVLSTLQTAGLLVGIFYYIMVLRNQQKNQEISLRNQELTLESQELTRKSQEDALHTRQAQLFMQIFHEYSSVENFRIMNELTAMEWDDYDDFMRKYSGETNREVFAKRYSTQYRFDGIGILVKAGLLDLERVHDLMWTFIVWHWDKYRDTILKHRDVFNNPDFMQGFEYLVNELKKMRVDKGFSPDVPKNLMRYVAQQKSNI